MAASFFSPPPRFSKFTIGDSKDRNLIYNPLCIALQLILSQHQSLYLSNFAIVVSGVENPSEKLFDNRENIRHGWVKGDAYSSSITIIVITKPPRLNEPA